MTIFVEWYPEHKVEDKTQMEANQQWAERCYRLLNDNGLIGTDAGVYVKRDGGLYRLSSQRTVQ